MIIQRCFVALRKELEDLGLKEQIWKDLEIFRKETVMKVQVLRDAQAQKRCRSPMPRPTWSWLIILRRFRCFFGLSVHRYLLSVTNSPADPCRSLQVSRRCGEDPLNSTLKFVFCVQINQHEIVTSLAWLLALPSRKVRMSLKVWADHHRSGHRMASEGNLKINKMLEEGIIFRSA